MKSHHNECDGKYFCAGTEDEAEFKRYIASPHRISNSFSEKEVIALDFIATQLRKGAYGPQPTVIVDAIQSLGKKAKTMLNTLRAQANDA